MLVLLIRTYTYLILTFLLLTLCSIYYGLVQIFRPFTRLHRALCDFVTLGETVLGLFQKHVLNVKFTTSGVPFRPEKTCLILMNHQCCFDWMFLWGILPDWPTCKTLKYVMKKPISQMPIIGPVVRAAGSIFLSRRWTEDQSALDQSLSYYRSLDYPLKLVFFPEGTTPSQNTSRYSLRYARDRSLRPFFHLLFPRTTGFSYLFNRMTEDFSLDCVYDITISYGGPIPFQEKDFLSGVIPSRVHFHVKRYETAEVESTGAEEWLIALWRRKEEYVREFHWGQADEGVEVGLNYLGVLCGVAFVGMIGSICWLMSRHCLLASAVLILPLLIAHVRR